MIKEHTVLLAVQLSLEKALDIHNRCKEEGETNSWVPVSEIIVEGFMLTDDLVVIRRSLVSNIRSKVEAKEVEGNICVRLTPYPLSYNNLLAATASDAHRVHSPRDHNHSEVKIQDSDIIYKDITVMNPYDPYLFNPRRLHVADKCLLVSTKELVELFPEASGFETRKHGCFIAIDDHGNDHSNDHSSKIVELLSVQIRLCFFRNILDAKICVYDSSKYNLVWSENIKAFPGRGVSGYVLQHHSVITEPVKSSRPIFLGS